MNPWAVEVQNLGTLPVEVEAEVLKNTVQMFVVGIERTPLFVFGVIPISLVARRGFIWVALTSEGRSAGAAVWRRLRKAWPLFYEKLGWSLLAFTKQNSQVERRFMEFFGLRETTAKGDYVFYEELTDGR